MCTDIDLWFRKVLTQTRCSDLRCLQDKSLGELMRAQTEIEVKTYFLTLLFQSMLTLIVERQHTTCSSICTHGWQSHKSEATGWERSQTCWPDCDHKTHASLDRQHQGWGTGDRCPDLSQETGSFLINRKLSETCSQTTSQVIVWLLEGKSTGASGSHSQTIFQRSNSRGCWSTYNCFRWDFIMLQTVMIIM